MTAATMESPQTEPDLFGPSCPTIHLTIPRGVRDSVNTPCRLHYTHRRAICASGQQLFCWPSPQPFESTFCRSLKARIPVTACDHAPFPDLELGNFFDLPPTSTHAGFSRTKKLVFVASDYWRFDSHQGTASHAGYISAGRTPIRCASDGQRIWQIIPTFGMHSPGPAPISLPPQFPPDSDEFPISLPSSRRAGRFSITIDKNHTTWHSDELPRTTIGNGASLPYFAHLSLLDSSALNTLTPPVYLCIPRYHHAFVFFRGANGIAAIRRSNN